MEETHWILPGSVSVIIGSENISRASESSSPGILTSLLDCIQIFKNSDNVPKTLHIDPKNFNILMGLEEAIQFAAAFSISLFTKLENSVEQIQHGDSDVVLDVAYTLLKLSSSPEFESVDILLGDGIRQDLPELPLPLAMIKEAEVSRHLGYATAATVSRLTRCLASFGFKTKTSLDFQFETSSFATGARRIFILERIGESRTVLSISNQFIRLVLQKHIEIIPSGPVFGTATIPGSKSISNRVLLLAALGQGTCSIRGLLDSDDTQVMLNALVKFGASFEWKKKQVLVVHGTGGVFGEASGEVYLNNAGTAARFLTSVASLIRSPASDPLILTGNARMKERPTGPLVKALRSNGCSIAYLETEGCLPIRVEYTGLAGGLLELESKISSQYVSSVLLSSPYAKKPLTLQLAEENPTSLPYITMTVDLMKSFGVPVQVEGTNRFTIPIGAYRNPPTWNVEPDASSATYFLALAAITGGEITVNNMGTSSLQGDSGFYRVCELMGCHVEQTQSSTTVRGSSSKLRAFSLNMETMTDAFMTAVALAAVAEGRSVITGIANQRVKECNRIEVMVTELTKLGVTCGELEDGIWVEGQTDISKFRGPVYIECHDDHRIAMSFAVLGSVVPGIIITDKECTAKTFPGFWDDCRLQLNIPLNIRPQSESPVIFLVGMRGCGKSTLGKLAAAALGLGFYNMDEMLEREFNQPCLDFVTQNGWPKFRKKETDLLARLMKTTKPATIISCGGGIVEDEGNRKLLANTKHVVNIEREFSILANFLNDDTSRPTLYEPVEKIWARRKPLYEQCSHFKFYVNGREDWKSVNSQFIALIKTIVKQE